MNEIIEEMNAQERLNEVSDEVKNRLDGQGAQDNLDVLDEGYEEIQRPKIDFSQWLDDDNVIENGAKMRVTSSDLWKCNLKLNF